MMARAESPASSLPARQRVVIPGVLGERPRALRFIIGVCRAHGLPSDVEEALVSAFGEAFNQAVCHSYARIDGTLAVEVVVARDRVTVWLRDRGAGFDLAECDEERRYGLFIMLRSMDEVRWWREGDENVACLVKRIPNQTT